MFPKFMARLRPTRAVRHSRLFGCVLLCLTILTLVACHHVSTFQTLSSSSRRPFPSWRDPSYNEPEQVTTVVASQRADNTTWLRSTFPSWNHQVYVTDDASAALTVPMNKGRESMVYLTYIIDNYDALPPVLIFKHANRYQWHADDPLYDEQRALSRVRIPYVQEQGYVNLRCVWTLGCPAEIHPFSEEGAQVPGGSKDDRAGSFYKAAFEHLFPGLPVPLDIGVSCCAEFAVTGWKIRERPRSDYERYRQWLIETTLPDSLSGRILEYSWHIIFGNPPVHCPSAQECYCNVFGLCDLQCESEGICKSQYTLPPFATMPEGWPNYGWDGRWQNASTM